jgi:hypothetical protein
MFFIDLHCHPNYKPFARAHTKEGLIADMSTNPDSPSSLWFYDPPSPGDKLAQLFLSVTKFSQANGTAAYYGNVGVMVVALGSVEQPFFKNKLGTGTVPNLIDDFAAGFKPHRIRAIEQMDSYWHDLQKEIRFITSGANSVVKIDGLYHTYRIAQNFEQLQQQQKENNVPEAGKEKGSPLVLSILFSIEGMHVLNNNIGAPLQEANILANVRALKNMPYAPWFVNISHHFKNSLCGHARSLRGPIGKVTDQEAYINAPFNDLGKKVVEMLLDKGEGHRILIDIKHMSKEGRRYFLKWRSENAKEDVPVIISHGVCNGLPHYDATTSNFPLLGKYFINPIEDVKGGDGTYKEHNSINFYDDEIMQVVESKGIMGLQLDERRLANKKGIERVKNSPWRNKIMQYRSELVWNQLRYMAEMLDSKGLFAWGHIAIGSDYDGIVDPLNSFWTLEQYEALEQYVERHAHNYFKDNSSHLKNAFNRISADEVVERLFHRNAWDFFRRWF